MTIDDVLENSFRNFHARGLDYLCLKRTADHTVKVYFFDGDADLSALPEIVMPHDHRYDFTTQVVAGSAANMEQSRCADFAGADAYHAFDWNTPLNGGDGFSYRGVEFLTQPSRVDYLPGQAWGSRAIAIHALRILRAGTILVLHQGPDVVPIGVPTQTFMRRTSDAEPVKPELAGLYDRMTPAYAETRLRQLTEAGFHHGIGLAA